MPTLLYVETDGKTHRVEAMLGQSVMQVAVDNMVPGILGDCGGCCSCATCHVYIDSPWSEQLTPKSSDESGLLEIVSDLRENSRLGCQIRITEAMDGMAIHLPANQM